VPHQDTLPSRGCDVHRRWLLRQMVYRTCQFPGSRLNRALIARGRAGVLLPIRWRWAHMRWSVAAGATGGALSGKIIADSAARVTAWPTSPRCGNQSTAGPPRRMVPATGRRNYQGHTASPAGGKLQDCLFQDLRRQYRPRHRPRPVNLGIRPRHDLGHCAAISSYQIASSTPACWIPLP